MLNASDAREDDEDYKNPVDLMFDRLTEKDPGHLRCVSMSNTKWRRAGSAKSFYGKTLLRQQ